MGVMSKIINIISKKNEIKHTNTKTTLTRHGVFETKRYKHKDQEYLAILSKNFFDVIAPIFYIHGNTHDCDALGDFCGCSYPISVALKMIHREGGLILYSSRELGDITRLLEEINAKELHYKHEVMIGENFMGLLKGYKQQELVVDFILKDLKLSNIQLVSDNANIIFIIQQRGIQIMNQTPAISFMYGDTKRNNESETLKSINEITFEYDKTKE